MTREKRVVSISLADKPSIKHDFPDHLKFLEGRGYKFYGIALPWVHPAKRISHFLRLAPFLRGAEVVLTSEYFNAAAVSAILRLTGSRARHAVIGLNVSNNRTLRTKSPRLNRWLNRLFFGRIDMAVSLPSRKQTFSCASTISPKTGSPSYTGPTICRRERAISHARNVPIFA